MPAEDLEQHIAKLEQALTEIDMPRAQLVEEIQTLRLPPVTLAHAPHTPGVTTNSKTADKLALFRSLFGGRPDVYAQFGTVRQRQFAQTVRDLNISLSCLPAHGLRINIKQPAFSPFGEAALCCQTKHGLPSSCGRC